MLIWVIIHIMSIIKLVNTHNKTTTTTKKKEIKSVGGSIYTVQFNLHIKSGSISVIMGTIIEILFHKNSTLTLNLQSSALR